MTQTLFAQSYAEARGKFLAAADSAGLSVQSHRHPLLGHDGEPLAMDVARHGPADAAALLLVSSGCHGVEGFCGSGVQNALLADRSFHAAATAAGVAVLYVHALNPWGFSWWRRTTHENVDLNRNWHDFSQPLPSNVGYDEIAHLLLPAQWPPGLEVEAGLRAWAAAHGGERSLQAAITAGQHTHADGLFYSGRDATWSQQNLRHVLQEHAVRCARLGWLDVHTGLGPMGHGERIFACRDNAAALARARDWWGPAVTSTQDGSSSSALLTGTMSNAAFEECPQAEYTGIALEYGTVPLTEMLFALREDQWFETQPQAPLQQRAAARQRIRDVFYIDTPAWKERIVEQGLEAAMQAVAGLGKTQPNP